MLKIFTDLVLFVCLVQSRAIRVIRTNPNKPLEKDGIATIQNSSVASLDQFTLCARILTYQFDSYFYFHQAIITASDGMLLWSFSSKADCEFAGCTEYFKSIIGDEWKYGRIYGMFIHPDTGYKFYPPWKLNQWENFCMLVNASNNHIQIYNRKLLIFESKENIETYKNGDIVLLNYKDGSKRSPMHGAITDVNVWNKILSKEDIENWTDCKDPGGGNFLNWNNATVNLELLEDIEMDKSSVCGSNLKASKSKQILGFHFKTNSVDEHNNFCQSIGLNVAVTENIEELRKMHQFQKEDCNVEWFFVGYIMDEGNWVNINDNQPMKLALPLEGQTNSAECLNSNGTTMYGDACNFGYCAVCETHENQQKTFQLRGVCSNSKVDNFYVFVNATYLLGYTSSEIIFNSKDIQWEIRNTRTGAVSAVMNETVKFPIGLHKWYFLNKTCKEDFANSNYRFLKMHLDVDEPGHFCCNDGFCIKSEFVCDDIHHCKNSEDEKGCELISNPLDKATDIPPIKINLKNGTIEKAQVLATIQIQEVFSVDQTNGIFEILFNLNLKWKDHNLKYNFLKEISTVNFFNRNVTWTPKINFFHTRRHYDYFDVTFIERNMSAKPILSGEMDVLKVREVYLGQDHFLNLIMRKRAEFICSFNQIVLYPFGDQECVMGIYIEGTDNKLTQFINETFLEPNDQIVGGYSIKKWIFEVENDSVGTFLIVKMVLTRKLFGVFMVTYLPTLLMNIINQASNHITGDTKYDMIFTINITSMMVLASIYLSVSSALPSSSTIKPVEWWLLANLAYPFLVIIVNILVKVALKLLSKNTNSFLIHRGLGKMRRIYIPQRKLHPLRVQNKEPQIVEFIISLLCI